MHTNLEQQPAVQLERLAPLPAEVEKSEPCSAMSHADEHHAEAVKSPTVSSPETGIRQILTTAALIAAVAVTNAAL